MGMLPLQMKQSFLPFVWSKSLRHERGLNHFHEDTSGMGVRIYFLVMPIWIWCGGTYLCNHSHNWQLSLLKFTPKKKKKLLVVRCKYNMTGYQLDLRLVKKKKKRKSACKEFWCGYPSGDCRGAGSMHTHKPLCLYSGTTWSISWWAGQLKTNQAARSTLVMGKPRLWRKWGWLMDIFTLWHNCLPQASITPGDNTHLLSRPTPMQHCQTYWIGCKCLE